MKLTVLERILASQALPDQGTFANLKLLRVAKESLSFTEEENKSLNFRVTGDNTQWDDTLGEVEIELGEVATEAISKSLKKQDDDGELRNEQFSLYEKFIN